MTRRGTRLGRRLLAWRTARAMGGAPPWLAASPIWLLMDTARWGALGLYIWRSRQIIGWTRGDEAIALARACRDAPRHATVVEIGSFLGCSTVLLAGARQLAGSGRVHVVDAFDASGDWFSVPVYRAIAKRTGTSLRAAFDRNVARAGLSDWVEVHHGRAEETLAGWLAPIDLLYLDGDQGREAVRTTHDGWAAHLRSGGVLALHNANSHKPGHDGSTHLAAELVRSPLYREHRLVDSLLFARRV